MHFTRVVIPSPPFPLPDGISFVSNARAISAPSPPSPALNDAVPGMAVGATRRISVTPRNGWEKNTRLCDGGPGGRGAGGELRTDYVVVPTATMVEQESCFDKTKLPFPTTYAQERRMAQRFDQSLILEVRLVGIIS